MQPSRGERVRRHVAELGIDQIAQWLELTLGRRLTAYAADVEPAEVVRCSRGDDHDDLCDRRLRNLYAVAWFVSLRDGPGTAYDWLVEPNPELDDHPPIELLHEGKAPESVWFAVAPVF